jgi:S-methylmethionine-dependent homocysteine/selenocysteine methylase
MTVSIDAIMQNGVILLDGGMGQELRRRSESGDTSLWSAQVMIEQPELVQQVHEDYIRAGAKVITTNTYATVRQRLEKTAGLGDRCPELLRLGGKLAQRARKAVGERVLIAGCLPPLHGSYRPDLVRPYEEIEPIYREHVQALEPFVDVFLCETMSNGKEAYAAAHVAASTGKPVWVAWTLRDDGSKLLRSNETIAEAWSALNGLPIGAAMANCCAPESITAAMPALVTLGVPLAGGYANGFAAIPEMWSIKKGVSELGQRHDLNPDAYAAHVRQWIEAGANIVGGCCEVGPEHIKRICEVLMGDSRESEIA